MAEREAIESNFIDLTTEFKNITQGDFESEMKEMRMYANLES